MSIIERDQTSRWNYAAYVALPPDGKRHEIIDGEHFVNPAPNLYHQEVSRHIQFPLYSQIELAGLGKVIDAPVDLQLSDHDMVQPDLVIVTRERKHILTPTNIRGNSQSSPAITPLRLQSGRLVPLGPRIPRPIGKSNPAS